MNTGKARSQAQRSPDAEACWDKLLWSGQQSHRDLCVGVSLGIVIPRIVREPGKRAL